MATNIDQFIASHALFLNEGTSIIADTEQSVFTYLGNFSQDFINSVSQAIEQILTDKGCSISQTKRVFSILVEGLQNVRQHGLSSSAGEVVGHLICTKEDKNVRVSIGNYINAEQQQKLDLVLGEFKNKGVDKIKQNYLSSFELFNNENNADFGLGLVLMVLKSKGQFEYNFLSLSSDIFYFNLNFDVTE